MRTVVCRLANAAVHRAFARWCRNDAAKTAHRRQLRLVVARMAAGALSKAWSAWQHGADCMALQREAAAREAVLRAQISGNNFSLGASRARTALARMCGVKLAAAWEKWAGAQVPARPPARTPARLPACPPAGLPACLPACPPACPPAEPLVFLLLFC
jgi:hypothetical protein